jgi:hypothetical protein
VNIETIEIDHKAISELYPGKKNAKPSAHKKIVTHKSSLKLITFQTIFFVSDLFAEISLIAIV